jgi:hypothetical protein
MPLPTYIFAAYQGDQLLGYVKATTVKSALIKSRKLWIHCTYVNGPKGVPVK